MKKTLITTLLALCTAPFVLAADSDELAPITLTADISEITRIRPNAGDGFTATTYTDSFAAPASNIGHSRSWTWTTSFELTEAAIVETVQAQLFTFTAAGKTQTIAPEGNYVITIKKDGVTVAGGTLDDVTYTAVSSASGDTAAAATYTSATEGSITSGSGAVVSYGIGELLDAGTYTMELTVQRNVGWNSSFPAYWVGVKEARVNLSAVPEPTTATLSLLALAGLAARRRR